MAGTTRWRTSEVTAATADLTEDGAPLEALHVGGGGYGAPHSGYDYNGGTGSYYTPHALVQSLLETALDPVLEEAAKSQNPEAAILALTVCDPATGSGHDDLVEPVAEDVRLDPAGNERDLRPFVPRDLRRRVQGDRVPHHAGRRFGDAVGDDHLLCQARAAIA